MSEGSGMQMKRVIFIVFFLHASFASAFKEVRGIWIPRWNLTSYENVQKIVTDAATANLNVLFVQSYARGEAVYKSNLIPRAEELNDTDLDFDPLRQIIRLAHKRGMEVHAWVNLLYAWSLAPFPPKKSHLVYTQPNWFVEDRLGRSILTYSIDELKELDLKGYFLTPAHPDARIFLRRVILELVLNYDIDGVHLDYVRYPHRNFAYDSYSRLKFNQRYGVDPIFVKGGVLQEEWKAWRIEELSSLVKVIYNDIMSVKPHLKLSCAVKVDPVESKDYFYQNWAVWVRDRYVDFVVPMCYSINTSKTVRRFVRAKEFAHNRIIYAGLGIYNQSPLSVADKVIKLRNEGYNGFVLFSYDGVIDKDGYFHQLRHYIFPQRAVLPSMKHTY